VIYGVTDLKPYKNNQERIKRFGELLILQMPDGMDGSPALDHKFTYQMQFSDGNNPGFSHSALAPRGCRPNCLRDPELDEGRTRRSSATQTNSFYPWSRQPLLLLYRDARSDFSHA
jgi:hypothetical protein